MDCTKLESNQDECRLCLIALRDYGSYKSNEITTSINEKICEIFPPELVFLQSSSNVICDQCHENLEICSSFRNRIVTRHQTVFQQVVKVESDPVNESVIIKTELFEENPVDVWEDFKTSSLESKAPEAEPIKKAQERENPLDCEICTFTTTNRNNLRDHLQAEHEENPNQCGICEPTFQFTQEIRSHTKQLHGSESISIKCLHCRFTSSPETLKTHQKLHGERKFCNFEGCDKMFYEQRDLNRHKKTAHPTMMMQMKKVYQRNQKNSKCNYDGCAEAFSTGRLLKIHVKLTHEKLWKKCPVDGCNYHNGRLDYMRIHLKRHIQSPATYEKHYKTVKEMNLV